MDATQRRAARSELRLAIIEFAKQKGSKGFTAEELHEAMGGHGDVVRSRLNSLKIAGRIEKMAGSELNRKGTAKIGRYRFKESISDAELEKAAAEYAKLHPSPENRRFENVDACIKAVGHDEDFEPVPAVAPTAEVAGSESKIQVMAARVALGQDIWHEGDAVNYYARCEQISERAKN